MERPTNTLGDYTIGLIPSALTPIAGRFKRSLLSGRHPLLLCPPAAALCHARTAPSPDPGQGRASSEPMHRWQHLLAHQVDMLQHIPLGHGRVEQPQRDMREP